MRGRTNYGGNPPIINGKLEQYTVASGETITQGDFVQFTADANMVSKQKNICMNYGGNWEPIKIADDKYLYLSSILASATSAVSSTLNLVSVADGKFTSLDTYTFGAYSSSTSVYTNRAYTAPSFVYLNGACYAFTHLYDSSSYCLYKFTITDDKLVLSWTQTLSKKELGSLIDYSVLVGYSLLPFGDNLVIFGLVTLSGSSFITNDFCVFVDLTSTGATFSTIAADSSNGVKLRDNYIMSNTPTLYPLVSGRYDSASGLYILTECYGYNSSSSESSSNLQILAYRINNDRTVDLVYNSGSVKTGYYQCLSLLRSGNLSGDGYYYQCLPSSTSTSNYAINIGAYRCSNSGLSLLGTLPLFTLPTTGYTYGISFFPMGLYINSNTLLIMCCSIESSTRYLEFKLVKLEDGIPTKILSTVKLKYSDFNALGYSNTTYDVCYGYGYLFKHGDDGVLAYFAIGGLDTCNTYIADLTVSDTQVIFNNIKKVKKYDGEGYSIGFSNQNGKAGEKIAVYVPN